MLTIELIEQRLDERRRQERQAFANFNAAHGAVQELENLLALLSQAPEVAEPETENQDAERQPKDS